MEISGTILVTALPSVLEHIRGVSNLSYSSLCNKMLLFIFLLNTHDELDQTKSLFWLVKWFLSLFSLCLPILNTQIKATCKFLFRIKCIVIKIKNRTHLIVLLRSRSSFWSFRYKTELNLLVENFI